MAQDKPYVLYIDDEVNNLEVFRTAFRRNYKVFTALSGAEGLAILEREPIQLVVTDQRMPGMTGMEFLQTIIPHYPEVMRIILTAYSDMEFIIEAINEGGIYQYVRKPWDRTELKIILDKALETYRLRQENKNLIQHLKEANQNLEAKVQARTQILEDQNQQLQERSDMIDLLLRELNHRVMNNLQVVSMLLARESRKLDVPEFKGVLDKIEQRVVDLAKVHRGLMYRKNNLEKTNLGQYFREITQLLSQLYHEDELHPRIDIETNHISLPQEQAYFLGFIVHELVTNAFKYAFEGIEDPLIRIDIQEEERPGFYLLKVSNNGLSFPSELIGPEGNIQFQLINSLGLKIIHLISRLHQGHLKLIIPPPFPSGTGFICTLYL